MASVTVRYYAVLREWRGTDHEVVAVRPGETVAALYARLFPPGPGGALPVGFARNREYVGGDVVVGDGDEIVFLPPLGGG